MNGDGRCGYVSPIDGRRCVERAGHGGIGHSLADTNDEEAAMLAKRGLARRRHLGPIRPTTTDDWRRP